MLLAASTEGERKVLILGLYDENLKRLADDQPIRKNLGDEGVPGLEEWSVYILGPEDTARFVAHYGLQVEGDE